MNFEIHRSHGESSSVGADFLSTVDSKGSLSVFIPVYNEINTIATCLGMVLASQFVSDVIIVDDFSSDGTREFLKSLVDERVTVLFHEKNLGKGAAFRTAVPFAKGLFFIFQDADLEYDPREYGVILAPLLEDRADVVYGSRYVGGSGRRVLRFWHSIGNKALTFISNCFTNLYLTDMATCYKCFKLEMLLSLQTKEKRFGIDPEITALIAKKKWRLIEVGVSYSGRSYDQGKKIKLKDAFRHIYCIIKYRLSVVDDFAH